MAQPIFLAVGERIEERRNLPRETGLLDLAWDDTAKALYGLVFDARQTAVLEIKGRGVRRWVLPADLVAGSRLFRTAGNLTMLCERRGRPINLRDYEVVTLVSRSNRPVVKRGPVLGRER